MQLQNERRKKKHSECGKPDIGRWIVIGNVFFKQFHLSRVPIVVKIRIEI